MIPKLRNKTVRKAHMSERVYVRNTRALGFLKTSLECRFCSVVVCVVPLLVGAIRRHRRNGVRAQQRRDIAARWSVSTRCGTLICLF